MSTRSETSRRFVDSSTEDTRQLVEAMVRGVGEVWLGGGRDSVMGVDMEALARYDGRGRCSEVRLRAATRRRYEAEVVAWAGSMGWEQYSSDWTTGHSEEYYLAISRVEELD